MWVEQRRNHRRLEGLEGVGFRGFYKALVFEAPTRRFPRNIRCGRDVGGSRLSVKLWVTGGGVLFLVSRRTDGRYSLIRVGGFRDLLRVICRAEWNAPVTCDIVAGAFDRLVS